VKLGVGIGIGIGIVEGIEGIGGIGFAVEALFENASASSAGALRMEGLSLCLGKARLRVNYECRVRPRF